MGQEVDFDRIRARCGEVADRARHVRVVDEAMAPWVEPLLAAPLPVPQIDAASHFIGSNEQTAAFFVTLAAVNFGSGYFPHLAKRPGMSGYFTIATSLKERFESRGPLSANELVGITERECADLFHQSLDDSAIAELMQLFATSWSDLGADLLSRFEGSFSALVASAEHSAACLVETLTRQPMFRDVSSYHGAEIPFFKRSQLLASDLALALDGRGLGRFDDLDRLTIFADNLVPHVLRTEGILEYSPSLSDAIEAEHLIAAGSNEEVEIRACSVSAVERIIQTAGRAGVHWTARDVDQVLWHRGQQPRTKRQGKRHRTRTVFY